jgi:hypothetical protein
VDAKKNIVIGAFSAISTVFQQITKEEETIVGYSIFVLLNQITR